MTDEKVNLVTLENPILRGFNPDPSIVRVGDDYYIVVSSFEWLPGIRVYHSSDLIHWMHYTDLLTNQVNLQGNPIDCSIWAPQLSFSNGRYYCVYTNIRNTTRPFKDGHNYLITATDMKGPWSAPIYLNSKGFDPSLYHDEEGRQWLLSVVWDYRKATSNKSVGICLQEYDGQLQQLVGPSYKIFDGTDLGKTEAPHLYYRGGYYYLLTAEGGTGEGHSVTVCRSKSLYGPYEVAPNSPIMTAYQRADSEFQCTGHGSLVQSNHGQWYMSYLMTRPVENAAILGRETSLQAVEWTEDGWLRLANGQTIPDKNFKIATNQLNTYQIKNRFNDEFNLELKKEWNGRRQLPNASWCDLKTRPHYLRMLSGESIQSTFDSHILAIRQRDFVFECETAIEFVPQTFNQIAGLLLFLNEENYFYLGLTFDEKLGSVLRLMRCIRGEFYLFEKIVPIEKEKIALKVIVNHQFAQFYWKQEDWQPFLDELDISFLAGGFTGNFIGVTVQDLDRFNGSFADFEYFRYQGKDVLNVNSYNNIER